jgi:hypothetical protein
VWLKFSKWLEENELVLPIGLTEFTTFLSELKKKDGEYISYGSLCMHALFRTRRHALFRSHDLLMARRGLLFSDMSNQTDTSCSRWGPMTTLEDGTPCPEYVVLILSNTATGKTEWRIDRMKGEAGRCPVAALFTYISMCKSQGDICTSLTSDDSIFLGITKSKDGSTMCYTSLTSPDPLAKDTKSIIHGCCWSG